MKYEVWSQVDETEVLELTRTEKRVAQDDAALIKTLLGRRAWVREVE